MAFQRLLALFTSSIINDASGKLGGNVFLRTQGGLALRANNGQTNPNTSLQGQVRAKTSILVNQWRSLGDDVQQGWRDIVAQWPYVNKVGQTKTYSGYALFMKLNGTLANIQGPSQAVGTAINPPAGKPTQSSVGVTLNLTDGAGALGDFEVNWASAGTATESLVVMATPPLSSGVTNPSKSAYRWLGYVTDLTTPTTLDLLSAYLAKYPTFIAGQKVGVKVFLVDGGTGLSTITEQLLVRPV